MEHESGGDTHYYYHVQYGNLRISTGIGGLGNNRTSGDHINYSIVEIGRNTKKSLGDLRRLAVTQTPVENHLLTLVGKTLKGVK